MPLLFQQYLVIGLGGALGSMLRFAVASFVDSHLQRESTVYYWGTMLVNITGCFIIGLIYTLSATEGRWFISPLMRQFILIGILGGYTTFSSFTLQTLLLAQDGQWPSVAANVFLSVGLCLFGVWLGSTVGNSLNQLR